MPTRTGIPRRWLLAPVLLAVLAGCRSRPAPQNDSRPAPPRQSAPESTPAPAARPRIVFLGDSLTAGLGLSPDEAYPALIQRKLDAAGYRYEVVNAGVSGDTTAGGLSRLEWSLAGDVRILVVALGGNDGLRGLPVAQMKENLGEIIRRARGGGLTVLLAGMEILTNLGPDYQREFRDAFPELARQHQVAFLPFLLEGVAGRPELNQHDGIHPAANGARLVADHVWTALRPLLAASPR